MQSGKRAMSLRMVTRTMNAELKSGSTEGATIGAQRIQYRPLREELRNLVPKDVRPKESIDMNKSLDDDDNDDTTGGTVFKMGFYEQSTLDGVVFIGLCVMCASILLMSIKLCYNYIRHFPVRKDSEQLGINTNLFLPKESNMSVRYSVA